MASTTLRLFFVALTFAALVGAGCRPRSPYDVNHDGRVDQADVDAVIACLGITPQADPSCAPADVIPNGLVDLADRNLVFSRKHDLTCNGSAHLCDRPYDQVSYAMAHNAYNAEDDGFTGYNQFKSMSEQLASGIRAMEIDTYDQLGEPVMCHGSSLLKSCAGAPYRPLAHGLDDVRAFMDANLGEIVTLFLEAYISEAETAAAFTQAGILGYAHVQLAGDPWPTLRTMIERGQRLIVLTQDPNVSLPWHHQVWAHVFDNPYSAGSTSEFSCGQNRGSSQNDLFLLNHFLTLVGGVPQLAAETNANPEFLDRALICEADRNHLPNFVAVDYFDVGDVFAVVDALNANWWVFEAETELEHAIGRAEGEGWAADTALDVEGHMSFGPYTTVIEAGQRVAYFRLLIDDNTADDLPVVSLDVYDATTNQILISKVVTRRQFFAAGEYQDFVVDFDAVDEHELEFRAYWHDVAYIRMDHVGVR